MSTTIVENTGDNSSGWIVLLTVLLLLGFAVAYYNGIFTSSTTVIENKTTVNKTIVVPAPAPEPVP